MAVCSCEISNLTYSLGFRGREVFMGCFYFLGSVVSFFYLLLYFIRIILLRVGYYYYYYLIGGKIEA